MESRKFFDKMAEVNLNYASLVLDFDTMTSMLNFGVGFRKLILFIYKPGLDSAYSCLRFQFARFLFFFFIAAVVDFYAVYSAHQWVLCTVHGTHKFHFSAIFSLKMGPTALFTHLKIILL